MSKLRNLVDVEVGPVGNDETRHYYLTPIKEFTVKEFVEAVLDDKREWGDFKIKSKSQTIKIEYAYGRLSFNTELTESILNSVVLELGGHGGWSNSDYVLCI